MHAQYVYSKLMARNSCQYHDGLRTSLYATSVPRPPRNLKHSHGLAAGRRSAADIFMETVVLNAGLLPYKISMSKKDQLRSIDGNRMYYEDKDLSMDPRLDPITSRHVMTTVDVDYFLDLKAYLLLHDNSFMAYTVIPEAVASNGETTHTFKNNIYQEIVPGGSQYNHVLWDFSADIVSVSGWKSIWMHSQKMYKVEKRQTSPNRGVVLLQLSWSKDQNLVQYTVSLLRDLLLNTWLWAHNKVCAMSGIAHIAGPRVGMIKHTPLKRLAPKQGEFNVLRVNKSEGSFYSIGRDGSSACVNISTQLFDVLCSAQLIGTKNMMKSTIESYLPSGEGRKCDSAILTDYLTNGDYAGPKLEKTSIVVTDNGIATFQWKSERGHDQDAKPCVVPIMASAIGEAPSPSKCLANDEQCIKGRVTSIAHKVPLVLTAFEQTVVNDFVMDLTNGLDLEPSDYDVVWDRQGRPTQRTILEAANISGSYGSKPIKCFMKSETYGKITDPRNIAQLPPKLKAAYSRFIYALADAIKTHPNWAWYAFGRPPIEIATKVASICSLAKTRVAMTDFSRMDGRKSNVGRDAWMMVLLKSFGGNYSSELRDLFYRQVDVRGVTSFGVSFQTGYTQLSGSPDTSLANSFETALSIYMALRKAHIARDEAMDIMQRAVFVGGDDGLVADVDPNYLTRAAKVIGHVLTLEDISRGSPGVNFLSRYFSPQVWFGHTSSICDVRRQLLKFHTTATSSVDYTKPVNRKAKLVEKCRALSLTDANTPVLGQLAETVLALSGTSPAPSRDSWWSQYGLTIQFPQDPPETDWMWHHVYERIPGYHALEHAAALKAITSLDYLVDLERPQAEFMDEPITFSLTGVSVTSGVSATLAEQTTLQRVQDKSRNKARKAKQRRRKKRLQSSSSTSELGESIPAVNRDGFRPTIRPSVAYQADAPPNRAKNRSRRRKRGRGGRRLSGS